MRVLCVLALVLATLWALKNFIPLMFLTIGVILAVTSAKEDGIDRFFAGALGTGIIAAILVSAFT